MPTACVNLRDLGTVCPSLRNGIVFRGSQVVRYVRFWPLHLCYRSCCPFSDRDAAFCAARRRWSALG